MPITSKSEEPLASPPSPSPDESRKSVCVERATLVKWSGERDEKLPKISFDSSADQRPSQVWECAVCAEKNRSEQRECQKCGVRFGMSQKGKSKFLCVHGAPIGYQASVLQNFFEKMSVPVKATLLGDHVDQNGSRLTYFSFETEELALATAKQCKFRVETLVEPSLSGEMRPEGPFPLPISFVDCVPQNVQGSIHMITAASRSNVNHSSSGITEAVTTSTPYSKEVIGEANVVVSSVMEDRARIRSCAETRTEGKSQDAPAAAKRGAPVPRKSLPPISFGEIQAKLKNISSTKQCLSLSVHSITNNFLDPAATSIESEKSNAENSLVLGIQCSRRMINFQFLKRRRESS